jgi:hypothetical protein
LGCFQKKHSGPKVSTLTLAVFAFLILNAITAIAQTSHSLIVGTVTARLAQWSLMLK